MTQPFQTVPLALRRWLQERNIPVADVRMIIEFPSEGTMYHAEKSMLTEATIAEMMRATKLNYFQSLDHMIIGGIIVKLTHRGENHG